MTIKKPMKTTTAARPVQMGGATIASRLALDTSNAPKQSEAAGKATTAAAIAGLLALVVAGVLTYILWQHWDFLMPA